MTDDTKIQYRLTTGSEPQAWLHGRSERMPTVGSLNEQARVELFLWQETLAAELARIRLTLAEASCLADVLNGTILDPTIAPKLGRVYVEAYDAFRLARNLPLHHEHPYGEKWNIDEDALLEKLATLGPAADHALRDAFARWWKLWPSGEATVEGFARVGLQVTDSGGGTDGGEADR